MTKGRKMGTSERKRKIHEHVSENLEGHTRGADKSLALERKQQATGLKKCIYILTSELHTLLTSLF
jgi:hypothetical protein